MLRYLVISNILLWYLIFVWFGHMSTACEHVYAKVARAAIEAGKRRRDLALTVAATSASSGSSGKRSNKSMEPTPSTHVTPEPKQSHTETPTVEPCALEFENAGTTGGGGNTTPDLFDVLWQVSCKHQLVFTSLSFNFWIRLLLRQMFWFHIYSSSPCRWQWCWWAWDDTGRYFGWPVNLWSTFAPSTSE